MPKHDGNLDLDFTDLNGNGVFDANLEFLTLVAAAPEEGCDEFLALGTPLPTALGQMGIPTLTPLFNATAQLPRYRFRFYTDGTRTEQVTALPPLPAVNPDGTVMTDERGLPIFGPVGRAAALHHGSWARRCHRSSAGLPGLRRPAAARHGAHRALLPRQLHGDDRGRGRALQPHDPASHPGIGMFPIHPRPGSFLGAESLSAQEKADLIEFLQIF
ncbi:MAG: hypothetical protein H5U40_04625 [Polyangiaceae bacterium]|nr:hypothetical protein [Polyangiaceae bacterium]